MTTIKAKFAEAIKAIKTATKAVVSFVKGAFVKALDKISDSTGTYPFQFVQKIVWMAWAIYTAFGILGGSTLLLQMSIVLGIAYIAMSVLSVVGAAWQLHTEDKKWEAALSDLASDALKDAAPTSAQ